MMNRRPLPMLGFVLCLSLLWSCSGFDKVKKSNDINYKLEKANAYFDQKRYDLANQLYYDLLPVMKNTRNYEALYWRYAQSYWHMKDYLSASYHFRNFVDFFPNSPNRTEAEYLSALSFYEMAPKPSLDPTHTQKALEALQSFINTHPESPHLEQASQYVDDLRDRLETKAANAAKLYYDIGQHKASGVAYKYVMRQYPASEHSDYYQYMVVRSLYDFAKESISSRQEERFAETLEEYRKLVDEYPRSPYLREAEKIAQMAQTNINSIRNERK